MRVKPYRLGSPSVDNQMCEPVPIHLYLTDFDPDLPKYSNRLVVKVFDNSWVNHSKTSFHFDLFSRSLIFQ